MGTSKRYADSIDERARARHDVGMPVGVIRIVKLGPRNETFYRVVTWAPLSADRQLVGYYATLADADRSILFTPTNPVMPRRPNEGQGTLPN